MVYSEAGPSRNVPPPRRDEPGRPPWPRRGVEDERDRDDGRSRLSEVRDQQENEQKPTGRAPKRSTGRCLRFTGTELN